jgi:small subunit ribosomal protein S5
MAGNSKHQISKDQEVLVEKVISIKKVSKTITGGKTMSFSVLVIVGDKKGKVGFGSGKDREVSGARTKALKKAKKSLTQIPLREGRTLHHTCTNSFGASSIILRPAVPGTGIIAGGAARAVLECLGLKDVVAKSLGNSNPKNVVLATFKALQSLDSPKKIAERRGKHISEIIKKRNVALKSTINEEKDE